MEHIIEILSSTFKVRDQEQSIIQKLVAFLAVRFTVNIRSAKVIYICFL